MNFFNILLFSDLECSNRNLEVNINCELNKLNRIKYNSWERNWLFYKNVQIEILGINILKELLRIFIGFTCITHFRIRLEMNKFLCVFPQVSTFWLSFFLLILHVYVTDSVLCYQFSTFLFMKSKMSLLMIYQEINSVTHKG